jgi:transposase
MCGLQGSVPELGVRRAQLADGGTSPSRSAAVALRAAGEAARLPGAAEEVGGVERTFAWLGQARRLAKDYESLPETAADMTYYWAMSRIMLRRLVSTVG